MATSCSKAACSSICGLTRTSLRCSRTRSSIHLPLPSRHDAKLNDKYYPKNKSHVELLLDQHFLIETYDDREVRLKAIFDMVIKVGDPQSLGEEGAFNEARLPDPHPSWSEAALEPWKVEPNEVYDVATSARTHRLAIDTTFDPNSAAASIHAQVMTVLGKPNARNRLGESLGSARSGGHRGP